MIITRRRWGAALLAGGLGMAAGCAGVPLAKESLTEPGALIFNGYSNPNANCFECHNGDGTGKFPHGPNLHDEVPKASDADIANTIRKGKSIMPGFEGKLSEAEIATLGTWLRATYGANAPPASATAPAAATGPVATPGGTAPASTPPPTPADSTSPVANPAPAPATAPTLDPASTPSAPPKS